ncbi:SpoIIIAH-like family protein [Metabacillus elymi]|uniref:SpoIIIAH-like family protein n=1 Tax=Metabacillus elymi TaxID=2745198 RepID=A0ABX6S9I1_9BACI|nr:SpoIIIAH-like family protein [Metabacillus sp. KUDC1714]QNF30779.1 SpoIIIAH-like family protein [Metabacillus sp. KUDC1714]
MLKKQTVWLLTMLSLVVVLSVYYVTSPDGGTSNIVMTEENQEVSENTADVNELAEEKQPAAEEEQPAQEEEKQPATEEEKQPAEEGKDGKDGKDSEKGESQDETGANAEEGEVQTEELEDGTVISSVTSDELFAELRMELEDQRSKRKGQLDTIVASNDTTPEEKNEAYDEMEALDEAAHKETVLETLIKSQGYDDALVRAEGNNVKITVKASKEHDKSAANKIMVLVRDEMENMENVVVTFEQ